MDYLNFKGGTNTLKKMKTLFKRTFDNHKVMIYNEVTEGCEWVLNGEGIAYRKLDGTCCLIQDNKLYKRFDYKKGRLLPDGAIPCQDKADEVTGHFPHWVECKKDNSDDKWHIKAYDSYLLVLNKLKVKPINGTYELIGKHINGNKDNIVTCFNILVKHDSERIRLNDIQDRSFEGIKDYLEHNKIEGIVFHRGNGEMCKIKRSDFGYKW